MYFFCLSLFSCTSSLSIFLPLLFLSSVIMPPLPTIGSEGIMFSSHPSGQSSSRCPSVHCPTVNTYFVCHDISVLSGGISVKLATNIHHMSGHCQRQRLKIKFTVRPNSLFPQRQTFQRCGAEPHLSSLLSFSHAACSV